MADIKTHLRELSVATTVGILANNKELNLSDMYSGKTFMMLARSVISNDISSANNLLSFPKFTGELRSIVDNGIKLGKKILESKEFCISASPVIKWLGNDTQKGDPVDITVDGYKFSLKEESFILSNMGLYTLLNSLTGSKYSRGLHLFSTFAPKEYDEWFSYTWCCFVNYLRKNKKWSLTRKGNISEAFLDEDNVILKHNSTQSTIPQAIKTNIEFMTYSVFDTRKKVFAKWINSEISSDATYLNAKYKCSVTAGEKVCAKINTEFSAKNAFDFFQIYPFEYYYAKTTPAETTILKVPAQADFDNTIEFQGCVCNVPSSQVNIISTFKNIKTGKTLQFRNECRFSHGQFNGTPEAKMYVVRKTPLTELYEPIE